MMPPTAEAATKSAKILLFIVRVPCLGLLEGQPGQEPDRPWRLVRVRLLEVGVDVGRLERAVQRLRRTRARPVDDLAQVLRDLGRRQVGARAVVGAGARNRTLADALGGGDRERRLEGVVLVNARVLLEVEEV